MGKWVEADGGNDAMLAYQLLKPYISSFFDSLIFLTGAFLILFSAYRGIVYIVHLVKPLKIKAYVQCGFGKKHKDNLNAEEDIPLFYIRLMNMGIRAIEIRSVYMIEKITNSLLEFDHTLPHSDSNGPPREEIYFPLTLKPGASQDFSCSALLNTESVRLPKNPTIYVEVSCGNTFAHKRKLKDMASTYNKAMDEYWRKQIGNKS